MEYLFIEIEFRAPNSANQAHAKFRLIGLAIALAFVETRIRRKQWITKIVTAVIAGAVVFRLSSLGPALAALYQPSSQAFMPEFAFAIHQQPEKNVVTLAHYDSTLLSYYLARQVNQPVDWGTLQREPNGERITVNGVDKVLIPLVKVHSIENNPEMMMMQKMDSLRTEVGLLVVERDEFTTPALSEYLSRCRLLVERGTGRLFECETIIKR